MWDWTGGSHPPCPLVAAILPSPLPISTTINARNLRWPGLLGNVYLSKVLKTFVKKKFVQSLPGTVLQSLSILPPLITQGRYWCWCWCWCWCWTCPAIQHFPQYPPPFISQGRGDKPGVLALIGPKEGLNHVKPVYCGLGREQSEVKTKIWRYMEVKVGVKVSKVGGICKWYGYVYDMIRYGIES